MLFLVFSHLASISPWKHGTSLLQMPSSPPTYFLFIHHRCTFLLYSKGYLNFQKHLSISISKKQFSQNFWKGTSKAFMMESLLTCTSSWSFQNFDQNKHSVENFLFPASVKRNSILYLSDFPKAASSTLRSETIFGNWKPFKNGDKCFLFHLQSFSRSQDIKVFVLTFWSFIKTVWLER